MSPRVSAWKSHGDTKTMSPSRIQTRLFSLPRTRHNRSLPSWHLTMILSAPSILTAMPNTSKEEGKTIPSMLLSFVIFLLPIFSTLIGGKTNVHQNSLRKKQNVADGLSLPLKNSNVKHLSLIHISEPTRLGMISYA